MIYRSRLQEGSQVSCFSIACLLFSVILGPDGDADIVSYIQGGMEPDVGIQDNCKNQSNVYIVHSE